MDSNMTYSASGVYGLLTDCRAMMEYGRSQPAQGYSHESTVHEDVKEYYGKILRKTADLKSNACMTVAKPMTSDIRNALKEVHPDVSDRYYGCGLAVPESLQGCRVLDLGCGSGRDCYMLSRLVGERGFVTGVDMTDEQLQVARKYIDYHTQRFGYRKPNTEFVQGYIEDLEDAGLKEGFYDIIISNCVVNLSPDKTSVLKQAHHVLKDGGELYFSDIYCNKDLPAEIRTHKVLWGECLGGALFWEDLMRLAGEVGFSTPRLVTASAVTVGDEELENLLEGYAERQAASRVKVSKTAVHKNKVKQETLETTSNQPGEYKFVSATYRLFKIPRSAPNIACLVIYNGNITGFEDSLNFDSYHTFKVNAVVPVDGELASILKTSRFAEEFSFQPCLADQPSSLCMGPKTVSWNPFEVENLEASRPWCGASKSCCK